MSGASLAELKARCNNADALEQILLSNKADFHGLDHQIDTYYKVKQGRLKLREGLIENTLIFYDREEQKGVKNSSVEFVRLQKDQVEGIKALLSKLHETLIVVNKKRKIFFIDNVKFHLDQVDGLGSFVEIEAIGKADSLFDKLQTQCEHYQNLLNIKTQDCLDESYSDMLLIQ